MGYTPMRTKMKLSEWPIYINDYGRPMCYHPGCEEELEDDWISIGRRTTFGEFIRVLIEHAKNLHQIELES